MYGVDDEDCGEFEVSMSMLFDGNHSKSWLEHEVITKDGETAVVSILRIDDIGGFAISGHVLWPTATALTDHFSKKWGDFDYFRHCKRMFELGCGAGLIGLGCATIGGEDLEMVVCSDYDASLFPALEKSVTKTRVCCSSVAPMETRTFDWTKPAYDSVVRQHSFDVVFGGDLIYAKECVADIFKSASLLLKDNGVFILSSSFINYPELVERYRAQNGFNRIHSERLNADTESPCLVEHFQLQMECPLNTGGQMVIQSQAIERHDWWTQVFLCLPPSDLIQFAFVCQSFHRVLALDMVARHIVVSRISERWPYLSVAEMDNLETLRESYRARNILETSWLPRVWTTEYRGSFEVGKYSRWVVPFIDPVSFFAFLEMSFHFFPCISLTAGQLVFYSQHTYYHKAVVLPRFQGLFDLRWGG
jgi:predicted RNA methylase